MAFAVGDKVRFNPDDRPKWAAARDTFAVLELKTAASGGQLCKVHPEHQFVYAAKLRSTAAGVKAVPARKFSLPELGEPNSLQEIMDDPESCPDEFFWPERVIAYVKKVEVILEEMQQEIDNLLEKLANV